MVLRSALPRLTRTIAAGVAFGVLAPTAAWAAAPDDAGTALDNAISDLKVAVAKSLADRGGGQCILRTGRRVPRGRSGFSRRSSGSQLRS